MQRRGFAIQCRITTEDPQNGFAPDFGVLKAYRSPGGFGVRLDAGSAYRRRGDHAALRLAAGEGHRPGGSPFDAAAHVMDRSLQEFRVRGVKTNIAFLENVMRHPVFLAGTLRHLLHRGAPGAARGPAKQDRGTKLLKFLGDVIVNGSPGVTKPLRASAAARAAHPEG